MSEVITFAELVALEPELKPLFQRARRVRYSRNSFPIESIQDVWHGRPGRKDPCFADELARLVGEYREDREDLHPILRTQEAYQVAYDAIYTALTVR